MNASKTLLLPTFAWTSKCWRILHGIIQSSEAIDNSELALSMSLRSTTFFCSGKEGREGRPSKRRRGAQSLWRGSLQIIYLSLSLPLSPSLSLSLWRREEKGQSSSFFSRPFSLLIPLDSGSLGEEEGKEFLLLQTSKGGHFPPPVRSPL